LLCSVIVYQVRRFSYQSCIWNKSLFSFYYAILGVDINGINLFCDLMGSGFSNNLFYSCLENIFGVYIIWFKKKLEEEKELNENKELTLLFQVTASGKSVFLSCLGFVVSILIGLSIIKYSKKVMDAIVKSSFCQSCNIWKIKLVEFEN